LFSYGLGVLQFLFHDPIFSAFGKCDATKLRLNYPNPKRELIYAT